MPFDNFAPPVDLRDFLDAFGGEFTEVTEIWLFGSRAEGLADARDWDLLVFSDDRLTPEAVSPAVHFRSDEFTLFIAVRDIFRRPWRRAKDEWRAVFSSHPLTSPDGFAIDRVSWRAVQRAAWGLTGRGGVEAGVVTGARGGRRLLTTVVEGSASSRGDCGEADDSFWRPD